MWLGQESGGGDAIDTRLLPGLNPNPDAEGLPAQQLIIDSMHWLRIIALWGSLASLLIGALVWGIGQLGSSGSAKGLGKSLLIGGLIGALIAGLAPTIVNELYNAGLSSNG